MSENAKKEKLEVKSFRISAETAEKFKEISAEIGGNQQQTMAKLIEVFELQQSKAVLPDYRANIEEFDGYLLAIGRLYTSALESNQLMKERIRAEFEVELQAKDAVIKELCEQIDQLKAEKQEAESVATNIDLENSRLLEQINQIMQEYRTKTAELLDRLTEKERLNQTLEELNQSLMSQLKQQEQQPEKPKRRRGRPPKTESNDLEGQETMQLTEE